ncbi:MAG: glycoside hydrolase family 13 protein [Eubacteriales bacterium]|nr:glycoside hydrolase family 13 protein [Eubacteriales bacterium]
MGTIYNYNEPDLRALFSDTTSDYISPPVPGLYKPVTIRLRVGRGEAESCFLVLETGKSPGRSIRDDAGPEKPFGKRNGVAEKKYLRMHPAESEEGFDYYEVCFEVTKSPLRYYFEVIAGGRRYRYTRRGIRNTIRPADLWHVVPGFHVPAWAEGAVMYQIFVDRFCNGDSGNDVLTGEYSYMGKPVIRVPRWDQPPSGEGYREFYGGDLQGVIDKLDYLQELGIEAIYLNPVFLSPSSHKYDTQDYDHIDPHFGRIVRDGGELLYPAREASAGGRGRAAGRRRAAAAEAAGATAARINGGENRGAGSGVAGRGTGRNEKQDVSGGAGSRRRHINRNASLYLTRVTDPANLAASDRLFADLVREAHARGIRVILDGVFNHCGSFHRWLDGEKIYERLPGGCKGARASGRSPYANYFRFERDEWPSNDSYEAWWGFSTLPKLNYEYSEELCNVILRTAVKWVSPPYNADGWRLDVAADLGHSAAFNHLFWKRFREAVKKANPEAIILAENYTNSQNWLQGDEWDTIMNYEFFMEPVTGFFTGMEKHSDARREGAYGNPDSFWYWAGCMNQDALSAVPLQISMNQLSNHDHSRFLTRTNRVVGRVQTLGPEAALEDTRMEIMRQAVLLQMTWTGAPTIYYGDEAGLGGFTDPDNRRTYPWGSEDRELIDYHRKLIAIRRGSPALRKGSLMRLPDEDGVLAYARFNRNETYLVLFNINYIEIPYEVDVTFTGIPREARLEYILHTDRKGFRTAAVPDVPMNYSGTGRKTGQEKQPVFSCGGENAAPPAERGTALSGEVNAGPSREKESVAPGGGNAVPPGEEEPASSAEKKDAPDAESLRPVPVHEGILCINLPPESGILLRWSRRGEQSP